MSPIFVRVALAAPISLMRGDQSSNSEPGDNFARLCAPFVDGLQITGASIAVFDGAGRQSTVCSTDALAARIDEVQFELGEGPQWNAFRTGKAVLIPDVTAAAHDAWPIFGSAITSLAVGALFAIPMIMGAATVGSVGLYRRTPGALTESDVATATVMAAAVVGVAVQLATAGADDHSASESTLAPAMRREVHQATGMIVVQLETTATVAFSRLRAYAFANERTVMDVAHAVVTRQLDFRSVPE